MVFETYNNCFWWWPIVVVLVSGQTLERIRQGEAQAILWR